MLSYKLIPYIFPDAHELSISQLWHSLGTRVRLGCFSPSDQISEIENRMMKTPDYGSSPQMHQTRSTPALNKIGVVCHTVQFARQPL